MHASDCALQHCRIRPRLCEDQQILAINFLWMVTKDLVYVSAKNMEGIK